MSAPLDPPNEQVMHLANYLARQLSRGIEDDLTGPTGRIMAQGRTPEEIALARQYAGLAVDLRDALRGAGEFQQLGTLPEYQALGSVPQIGVLRVYERPDERPGHEGQTVREYRETPFTGGPFFSRAFAEEMIEHEEVEGYGPSTDGDYARAEVGDVLPFNLYSG